MTTKKSSPAIIIHDYLNDNINRFSDDMIIEVITVTNSTNLVYQCNDNIFFATLLVDDDISYLRLENLEKDMKEHLILEGETSIKEPIVLTNCIILPIVITYKEVDTLLDNIKRYLINNINAFSTTAITVTKVTSASDAMDDSDEEQLYLATICLDDEDANISDTFLNLSELNAAMQSLPFANEYGVLTVEQPIIGSCCIILPITILA